MTALTTIKVTPQSRDRLRRWADTHDVRTLDDALHHALDIVEARDAMAQVSRQMVRMQAEDPAGWAEYLAESDAWSRTGTPVGDARAEYPEFNA
jgi:hypothetical protein